jgi:hypothetical protein
MVKTIMPLTKLKANPKNRFGSYLHVAVRYGQFEIFKIIFKHLKKKKFDWLQLKVNRKYFKSRNCIFNKLSYISYTALLLYQSFLGLEKTAFFYYFSAKPQKRGK